MNSPTPGGGEYSAEERCRILEVVVMLEKFRRRSLMVLVLRLPKQVHAMLV